MDECSNLHCIGVFAVNFPIASTNFIEIRGILREAFVCKCGVCNRLHHSICALFFSAAPNFINLRIGNCCPAQFDACCRKGTDFYNRRRKQFSRICFHRSHSKSIQIIRSVCNQLNANRVSRNGHCLSRQITACVSSHLYPVTGVKIKIVRICLHFRLFAKGDQ